MSEHNEIPSQAQYISEEECAEFQATMAARIDAGEDLQQNPHMLICERCRALMGELETMAQVIRDLFPTDIEPRDELWTKIERQLTNNDSSEGDPPTQSGDSGSKADSESAPVDGSLAFEGGIA